MKLGFGFSSCEDGLNILFDGNVYGYASLMNDFLVLSLVESYNNNNNSPSVFVPHFDADLELIKWYARLGHIGQDRMNKLAKIG